MEIQERVSYYSTQITTDCGTLFYKFQTAETNETLQ